MSDDYLEKMSGLETEFTEELRGYGSLAVVLAGGSSEDLGENGGFLGYDIRPEDIEALYFEGIGTPRWESIKAETTEEQLEMYNDSMNKIMADYPMIHRVSDTDVKVEYNPEETKKLQSECEQVLENNSDPKAERAVHKFLIACHKASDKNLSLHLVPNS